MVGSTWNENGMHNAPNSQEPHGGPTIFAMVLRRLKTKYPTSNTNIAPPAIPLFI
jgi:hypothetical protein